MKMIKILWRNLAWLVALSFLAQVPIALAKSHPNKALETVKSYLSVIGYDRNDKEYPLLDEAVTHYFSLQHPALSSKEMKQAKAIVGFSFGLIKKGKKNYPGPANKGFAKIMTDLHKQTNLPVLAQWEIAELMQSAYHSKANYAAYPKDGYLSTIGVIDQFEEKKLIKKGDTLILVANYDHGFRVKKLLEKRGYKVLFGKNSYTPKGGWLKQFDVDDEYGYFSESTQVWTKSRANFISEEIYWLVNELYNGHIKASH